MTEERVFYCRIRGQNDNIRPFTSGIEEFLERWEAAPNQQYFVAMAAEEICLSIMQKGFGQESLEKSPEEKSGQAIFRLRWWRLRMGILSFISEMTR